LECISPNGTGTEDFYHTLDEQQNKFPPLHTHVFTGDFNAHVAEEQEEALLALPIGIVPPRKGDVARDDTSRLRHPPAPANMSTVTDHVSSAQRGRLLLRMLNNIGYIILNGRYEPSSHPNSPPSPPLYTLQREQGRIATIIDYCLASTDQFQRVKSCNVIPKHVHNLTTDHNPIHLRLLIPRDLDPDESPVGNEGKDPHVPRLRFHSSRLKERDVAEQFKKRVEALSQEKKPDMDLLLSKLNDKSLPIVEFADAANHIIVSILHKAGEEILSIASTETKHHRSTQVGYHSSTDPAEANCHRRIQALKNQLRQVSAPTPQSTLDDIAAQLRREKQNLDGLRTQKRNHKFLHATGAAPNHRIKTQRLLTDPCGTT
jgi:hypothetical protein